jgi:hypothetical protein
MEHKEAHMSKEQRRILLNKLDSQAQKDIPASAVWHFLHKPYTVDERIDDDGGEGTEV